MTSLGNFEGTQINLAAHTTFTLPFKLTSRELKLEGKREGISDGLVDFVKDVIVEGFVN